MKRLKCADNEHGFALVLSLMIMAGMAVLSIAVYTTSTTDMYIARNENEAKKAFYLAETGLEEVLGRMDVPISIARSVGENDAERVDRRNGSPSYVSDTFDSTDLGLGGLDGTYSVTMNYATEAASTWTKGTDDNEIVLYGQDFGFGVGNVSVPVTGFVPVYEVESVGQTTDGTPITITAYVTESSLNVIPPAGDVFSNGEIKTSGAGVVGGEAAGDPVTSCGASCTTVPQGGDVDMDTYIGMPLEQLRTYADPPSPYDQSGSNTVNYDADDWADPCSSDDIVANVSDHICDLPADLIFIDNAGNGDAQITGGAGRGILVITGDFNLSGNVVWEGMIYVMGDLKGTGTITCFGTIMADDSVEFNGTINIAGSKEVASSVAGSIGFSRMVRWSRI